MTTFTTSTAIAAPRDLVWAALADIGSISAWNPGVLDSHTTSEEPTGLGASRHCDLGGRNYLDEQVVRFEDGEAITMRVIDSNLPFEHADIHFTLGSNGDATTVTVAPEYRLKFGPVGRLMDRLVVRKTYEKGMTAMLEGLKRHLESDEEANEPDELAG